MPSDFARGVSDIQSSSESGGDTLTESPTVVYDESFGGGIPNSWTLGDTTSFVAAANTNGLKLTSAAAATTQAKTVWRPVDLSWNNTIVDVALTVDRGQFGVFLGYDIASYLQVNVNYAFSGGANANVYAIRNSGATNTFVAGFVTDFPAIGTVRHWRVALSGGRLVVRSYSSDPIATPNQDPLGRAVYDLVNTNNAEANRLAAGNLKGGIQLQNSAGLVVTRYRVSRG